MSTILVTYTLFGKSLGFLAFKIENGKLFERSLPIWMVHYMQYLPGPNASLNSSSAHAPSSPPPPGLTPGH